MICSVRKRADDLKNQLENIVIPMFCSGQMREFYLRAAIFQRHLSSFITPLHLLRGQRGAERQIIQTAVVVGIEGQLFRCLRYFQTEIARFVHARVSDKFVEHIRIVGRIDNATNQQHIRKVQIYTFQSSIISVF